jgi:4-amino-4-deoxy-L-arabinose transferase-like glycosyltransferase
VIPERFDSRATPASNGRAANGVLDPWVIASLVVGTALRFVNVGAAPLWFDETFSVYHTSFPWHGFVNAVIQDNQAPIYYATLKAWTALAGTSPAAMRIPGLVASAACIPLVAACAYVLAGTRAARAAAWLTAVSPYLIQHAQDARPYAMLAAFAVADFLVLLRFVTGRSRRLGILWVLLAVAVIETHYYGIFFLAGQGLALLILHPRPLRSWLPAGVVAGTLCAAAVVAAAKQASGVFAGQYVLGVSALPGVVWSMLTGYTLMPTSEALHALGPRAILPDLPLALAAAAAFGVIAWHAFRRLDARARVVVLATFGVALLLPFAYRVAAGAGVHPRYFAAAFAPLAVIVAAGMAPPAPTARGIATAVLAIVMLYATALHLADPAHGREDVLAAGAWLDANVPPDEEILITSTEMEHLARFHWPQRRFRLFPSARGVIKPSDVSSVAESLPFTTPDRSIFIVGRAWLSDPDGRLQKELADRYPSCPGTDVRGIRILCFRPQQRNTTVAGVRR